MTDDEAFKLIEQDLLEGRAPPAQMVELLADIRRKFDWAMAQARQKHGFKTMTRHLALQIPMGNDTFVRAGGDVICGECEMPYVDHPKVREGHLNILCNGRMVHL